VIAAALALLAASAVPPSTRIFDGPPHDTLDPRAQAWHRELEREGDYGEDWFLPMQTDDGGAMVVQVFVTNLGLRTFDGGYDVGYYPPAGAPLAVHREVTRAKVSASETGLDVRVGGAHLWRAGAGVKLVIDDPELSLELELTPELPAYQAGNGRIEVAAGKWWDQGIEQPRARTAGSLRQGERRAGLAGLGYLDHAWSTIKIPTLMTGWRTLRLHGPRHTVVLHDQALAPRWGGVPARFGLISRDGAIIADLRGFDYQVLSKTRDAASGQDYPTSATVDASAGGWRLHGKLTTVRLLDSIDVLGRVSWPVRLAIKAFYSSPFTLRALARCELELVGPGGEREPVAGVGFVEFNYY
jgi:hypothetical protein